MIKIDKADAVPCEIFGTMYDLTRPTLGQLDDMDTELKADLASSHKVLISFIGVLGLPEAAARDLTAAEIQYLITELSGTKKK